MKKIILLIVVCISLIQITYAQDTTSIYKKFRVDLMLGGAFSVKGYNQYTEAYGGIFSVEPRYNLNDKFSIGLRYVFSEVFNNPDNHQDVRTDSHSFLANATYTAGISRTVRLYTGAGVGVSSSTEKVPVFILNSKTVATKTEVAFMPRAGVQIWRFTTDIFYNYTGDNNTNFAGMAFGFYFGGGKRNK